MEACRQSTAIEGGHFVSHGTTWPLPAIGLPHFSGRYLRGEEYRAIMGEERPEDVLYAELLSKGLLLRPGFKYGCRWRAYEEGIEVAHAPWLVQPEGDAPKNWEEVCLAVRLAEGVNKRWICAQQSGDSHSFLNINDRMNPTGQSVGPMHPFLVARELLPQCASHLLALCLEWEVFWAMPR